MARGKRFYLARRVIDVLKVRDVGLLLYSLFDLKVENFYLKNPKHFLVFLSIYWLTGFKAYISLFRAD